MCEDGSDSRSALFYTVGRGAAVRIWVSGRFKPAPFSAENTPENSVTALPLPERLKHNLAVRESKHEIEALKGESVSLDTAPRRAVSAAWRGKH